MKLKYIKLFEEFGKIYELKIYKVLLNDEVIYDNIVDLKNATNMFDNITESDSYNDDITDDIFVYLFEYTNKYKFLLENDEFEDYPLDEYFNDEYAWELIDEGDVEGINDRSFPSHSKLKEIEDKENITSFKDEVEKYILSIVSNYKYAAFMNSTFYGLYPYIDGYIVIRIADHFFNINNVNLGKNVVWNSFEGTTLKPVLENIYGFLSINIINDNYIDHREFEKKYKDTKKYSKYPCLISSLTYDTSSQDISEIDFISDIKYELNDIKNEIDESIDILNEKDEDGDYIKLDY